MVSLRFFAEGLKGMSGGFSVPQSVQRKKLLILLPQLLYNLLRTVKYKQF